MELIPEDLQRLYGDRFFIVPGQGAEGNSTAKEKAPSNQQGSTSDNSPSSSQEEPTGKLVWRPKPASKVLFILHASELKNKELTDLLKKIVESIKIPFEAAGFGVLTGDVNSADFQDMPNPFGVLFDSSIRFGDQNPLDVNGGKLFFTYKLSELMENRDYKKELWEQLQEIQSQI